MRDVEWEACLLEPRVDPELERRFRRETGRPPGGVRYLIGVPWLTETLIFFSAHLETRVALDPELADLAGAVVSQDNSCRYCFANIRAFLQVIGMSKGRISRLEENLVTAEFDARSRAALEFSRRVSRSDPLPSGADLQALRDAGFDELEIAELAGAVGLHLFFNRLSTIPALPPYEMESMPERWNFRILRPWIAFRLRAVRRRAPLDPLRPEERSGPFSPVPLALDGLPMARHLRRSIDGMWDSKLLSRRAKALVFAVVARALGCGYSEQEAIRLLCDEGLEPEQIDDILAHLGSPVLDPVEKIIAPFARETVWYQPAQIQRRGREVMNELTREQFLELIAVAALANLVCRLEFLTDAAA
jgi:alkylhydroperoxidase family enzyme